MSFHDTIFSFVVDIKRRFTYEGLALARSLTRHCGGDPSAIHVNVTPEVDQASRQLFQDDGYQVHEMARFGDGKHCNKLNQLPNLAGVECKKIMLLDADVIAIRDVRPFLSDDVIMAKTVDGARPPLETLDEIAEEAGLDFSPIRCETDLGEGGTYVGNCNGGVYSVPKPFAASLAKAWQYWALWLRDRMHLLNKYGMPEHVDQVSFWMALQSERLPFKLAPANINFFPYFKSPHKYDDERRGVALVHYHSALNTGGLLSEREGQTKRELDAMRRANRELASRFDMRAFWDFRYERWPKLGSGKGSRDNALIAKRNMLRDAGIEQAASVLDIGCGDIEAVKEFTIQRYVGMDISQVAVETARKARPDWTFTTQIDSACEPAEMVLCLDVLPLQQTEQDYRAMVNFISGTCRKTLIVSGFDKSTRGIKAHRMLSFFEPIRESLARTGRFRTIEPVASFGDTTTYKCSA